MPNLIKRGLNGLQSAGKAIKDSLFGGDNYTSLGIASFQPAVEGSGFRKAEETFLSLGDRTSLGFSTYAGSDRPDAQVDRWEREIVEPEARKAEFRRTEQMLADDPMLSTALDEISDGALGDDFEYVWLYDLANETEEQKRGREALLLGKSLYDDQLPTWGREWLAYGDGYYQIVADENDELVNIKSMPVFGMERLSDHTDEFPDPKKAYKQRGTLSREEYTYFSDFKLTHARYRRRTGDRYGRSKLFPSRQSSRDSVIGHADLRQRRKRSTAIATYLPEDADGNPLVGKSKEQFEFGDPGDPKSALPEVRAQRGDLEAVETDYPYRMVNGGNFRLEAPDLSLGEVRDLQALTDRSLAPLRYPRALITGDVTTYATADKLISQVFAVERVFQKDVENHIIRELNRRILLLYRVNAKSLPYKINWGAKYTQTEAKDNANLAILLSAQGKLNEETLIEICCEQWGRKDAAKILQKNREARARGELAGPSQPLLTNDPRKTLAQQPETTDKKQKAVVWSDEERNKLAEISDQDLQDAQDFSVIN